MNLFESPALFLFLKEETKKSLTRFSRPIINSLSLFWQTYLREKIVGFQWKTFQWKVTINREIFSKIKRGKKGNEDEWGREVVRTNNAPLTKNKKI